MLKLEHHIVEDNRAAYNTFASRNREISRIKKLGLLVQDPDKTCTPYTNSESLSTKPLYTEDAYNCFVIALLGMPNNKRPCRGHDSCLSCSL